MKMQSNCIICNENANELMSSMKIQNIQSSAMTMQTIKEKSTNMQEPLCLKTAHVLNTVHLF